MTPVLLGRTYKTVYAAATGSPASISHYNNLGQLEKQVDPDGVTTLYAYNDEGNLTTTAVDMDGSGTITTADRVTHSESDVVQLSYGDMWYGEIAWPYVIRRARAWQTNDANQGVLVSERLASVDGLRTASIAFGLTNQTFTEYLGSGQRRVTQTAPDGTQSVSLYQGGRLANLTRYAADGYSVLGSVTYGYDTHGRQSTITDLRNGTTTLLYNLADLVVTNTSPSPDGILPGQETVTHYDTSLRATNVVRPDTTSIYTAYHPNGLVQKTWGSRNYPVEYAYDYAGRMTNMTTWQDFNQSTGVGISGAATTTWIYNDYRGWLDAKRYHDDKGPDYTYTPAGRLDTRTWARGVETDYDYNAAGDLAAVDYSDATPDVGYGYDRRGRQTTVTNGGSLWVTRTYHDAGQLLSEAYSAGPLSGLAVTNGYDALLRRTNLALLSSSTPLFQHSFQFDPNSGRLETVSDGTNSATYSYLANSSLVEQIQFTNDSTWVMTTTKEHDYLNRLKAIESSSSSFSSSSSYHYNSANQRTSVTNVDRSYWVYAYDDLGQVTSGKKYWADGTPVAGQQFTYGFDDIGNREVAASGGDQSGANLRSQSYTANLLNQYESRTVPGFVDILGSATNTATVTVNLQPAYRKGDYYRAEVALSNTVPLWLGITNIAVLQQGTNADIVATNIGHLLVPQTPETFTHDADGNLTSDSLWTNTWNAENRRTVVESSAAVPAAGRVREQWTFLPDGRWIERIVSTWNTNTISYQPSTTNRFVWDGNVLLAVLNRTNGVELSFMRGLDLSGTLQGAGGVGGLLAVHSTLNDQPSTHFACFDGNGNVMALVDAATGEESARYEYGPFGEVLRMTGLMAKANPIRFSTQYADDVTGDLKYLYRDYRADLGRWPNRDPIGELGFETLRRKRTRGFASAGNLYGFVSNNPLNSFDVFGLYEYEWEGNFTEAEKQAIKDSINRVRDRANALIKQMDDNIKMLSKCPCPAYDELIKNLKNLKKILQGMVKEIDDPGHNLEIYRKSGGDPIATYWDGGGTIFDDELTIDGAWFSRGTSGADEDMFHEITHGQGTNDEDPNDYNNAHSLDDLMHTDKENWIFFKRDKKNADKKCIAPGK